MKQQTDNYIDTIESDLNRNPNYHLMKKSIAHGRITVHSHTRSVAETSLAIAELLKIRTDKRALITGALLHDYYLYDWHACKLGKLHGFHHPRTAMNNAIRDYQVDPKVQNIILSHMWPLTLTNLPLSREAVIVCIADKISATNETLFRRNKQL